MRKVNVSAEYLDSVVEWMFEWASKEDALSVPQFLQERGIGYPYLKYFCSISEKVNNTFEIVKSVLHNRWLHKAMTTNELPVHQQKLVTRYIRLYDGHGLDVERDMKEKVEETRVRTEMNVLAENYARDELKQPYQQIYESNVNKRRGQGSAK